MNRKQIEYQLDVNNGWKICRRCLIKYPLEMFGFRKERGYYYNICKSCGRGPCKITSIQLTFEIDGKYFRPCNKCGRNKQINEFYDHYPARCKDCIKEQIKLYRQLHTEKLKIQDHNKYEKYKEKVFKRGEIWRKNHGRKVYLAGLKRRRIKNNKNPMYKLIIKVRKLMTYSLKEKKMYRNWEKFVGYTAHDLYQLFISSFKDGMTWEKYLNGEIVLDHFFPVRLFKFKSPEDEEFKLCWSLRNLRPEWARDNERKSDILPYDGRKARHLTETERIEYIERYVKPMLRY